MSNVSRIIPRLKDIFTLTNKNTYVRVFYNNEEIDYDLIEHYKDFYIFNIELTSENGIPAIRLDVKETMELVYFPNSLF